MLVDLWLNHLRAELPDGRQRTSLILAHKPGIAYDIRSKDSGKAALDKLLCHSTVPLMFPRFTYVTRL
jgi:hypothetical protein